VEAILAHELAHIIRRDYLSNLIQSFIETLFYYHPVTWWISAMVRAERENRADDLAVSWCGDHLGYAKALIRIQEMETQANPSLAIGFASRKGAMLVRIQRILNLPYKNHNQMEKTVLLSLCSLCFLAFTLTSHPNEDAQSEKDQLNTVVFSSSETKTDSIPAKGTYRIHKKTDDQDISIEVQDGSIKELKVDGKTIQSNEFDAYGPMIDDLFGSIEAPPSMEGFNFKMPSMPPIPPMPPMNGNFDFDFKMPAMPPMPDMPEIEYGFHFDGKGINLRGEGNEHMKIIRDKSKDGSERIIMITNGDSTVISASHIEWTGDPSEYLKEYKWNAEDLERYADEWRGQAREWKEQWRDQQLQYRDQQEQYRDQWRDHADQIRSYADQERAEQQRMRETDRSYIRRDGEDMRVLELEGHLAESMVRGFNSRAPRLSLSDEMVRDGLVQPGAEVEIQLTPDKLKINGKKMPDGVHQKYLRMYEQQQGVELSGNSRVEFITKSKQRM
jgi:hypothetical protein